jgi:uncharacterized membrane protein (UPF0136 family)
MAAVLENLPLALLTIVLVVRAYYIIFAVLTLVGGIMGYVKAKSYASIISGFISGGMLIAAAVMLTTKHPARAYVIGLLVSVLLAWKFVPDFVHKKAVVPGGLMALLSLAGIVLTLLAWYGK